MGLLLTDESIWREAGAASRWVAGFGLILASAVAAWALERAGVALGRRLARLSGHPEPAAVMIDAVKGPVRFLVGAALLSAGERLLDLPARLDAAIDILLRSMVIVALAWLLGRLLLVAGDYIEARIGQNLDAGQVASVRTQIALTRRILGGAVYAVSAALLLAQFPAVRNVGVSLLASAGIAGLVLGVAAQKSLSAMFAGIQLSLAQPIRIGDLLVVEGERGTVEQIGLISVVVRTWDSRRLVFPSTYFLEKPFQNWSKGPGPQLGSVQLLVDFTVDVAAVRAELARILALDALAAAWDGNVAAVRVTETNSSGMTLQVVVSAPDPDKSYELRCLVREKLVAFLAQHPRWLPQARGLTL